MGFFLGLMVKMARFLWVNLALSSDFSVVIKDVKKSKDSKKKNLKDVFNNLWLVLL